MSDHASFSLAGFRERPGLMTGIAVVLLLRYLFGLFYAGAAWNKLGSGWAWTDKLKTVFAERLEQLEPGSFAAIFLEKFGIPFYLPIAWIVTIVEVVVPVSLFLGLATRLGGALAFWLMFMFAIGGYYDASLLPLLAIAALFVVFPTGHWFGMDRKLHARHPDKLWFR